ncbi:putative leucine-rich repeat domain superfamily [Helianthus debilis subsp. tardiflorus]
MDSLKYFHDDDINMSIDNTDLFICLQRLVIDTCPKLVSLPSNLPNLKVLKVLRCGGLISLPDNLPKLEDLELGHCYKLISLPCNLPSIRKMKFEYCDGLLSLPDEIQSFKDLNKLDIRRCKHLRKRCEREKGEDWHKISHIPDLSIQAPFYREGWHPRLTNDDC